MSDEKRKLWRAVKAASEHHGIPAEKIVERSHLPHIVDARKTAFAEARQAGLTIKAIARFFGLDWSTVAYHLRTMRDPSERSVSFIGVPAPTPPEAHDLPPEDERTNYQKLLASAAASNKAMRESMDRVHK